MSKSSIFEKNVSSLPQNDPRIVRVELDKSDIGGRKSAMPSLTKNDMSIQHVK